MSSGRLEREVRWAAVLLAGGRGSRIWPYAEVRNKVALQAALEPIIRHGARAVLHELGIPRWAVVTGPFEGSVRDALGGLEPAPRWVAQGGGAGTAAAAASGLAALGDDYDLALLLCGDCWLESGDLGRLLERAQSEPEAPAVLVSQLRPPHTDPHDAIGLALDGGRVRQVLLRPREDLGHRWAGALVLPRALAESLAAVAEAPNQVEVGAMPLLESDLGQWLGRWVEAGGAASAVQAEGLCCDVDRPWDLLWLNCQRAGQMAGTGPERELGAGASIDPAARVTGRVRLGRKSVIGPGAIIRGGLWAGDEVVITDGAIIDGPVVIGDRTVVARYCQVGRGSVLGRDCRVLHGAEVEGLFFDRVYAYHYGEFDGICGTATDLGAATVCGTLRFDDGVTEHRVGARRERPGFGSNASYLGDYCRTGVNAILLPGAKVGPYSVIGPGTIVEGDVPARTLLYAEQKVVRRSWGPERYAW